MKKTYKKIWSLIGFCGLMAFGVNAQISGVVTINSGAATAGTNYQTFNDLATALNTNGVNGPLTVNVMVGSGPYVEQVAFNQITGVSASNRIVINGNGNALTFNSTNSTAPHTLLLNGTDRMSINNLNVIGDGVNYALVCVLTNDANFNNFDGCTFTAPVNGTSGNQCAFAISGSGTNGTTAGNGGNWNTISTSTMSNGYYGISCYGTTSAPYTVGHNSFIGCRITDYYYYGFNCMYSQFLTVKNCIIDRETRTASTTNYVMRGYYSSGMLFEGNLIHKIYESNQGYTGTLYVIYNYGNATPANRNVYRNNIITNIKNNGTTYGIYAPYAASDIYNNTVDFDYAAGTSGNSMYCIYSYGNTTAAVDVATVNNNIVTCRRGGSGSNRYGIYFGTNTNSLCDNNNVIMVAGSGNNNIGYYNAAWTTLTQWQTAGRDLNGYSVDPQYVSASDLHPTDVTINNMALPLGLVFDQQQQVRNQATPDIGALEFLTPLCSGTPTISSVASPTYVLCPGESTILGLTNLNASAGITYSWSASQTSNVGPWNVPIQGTTTSPFVTTNPVTANTWYNVVTTCTLPGGGTSNSVGQVLLSGNTTSVVPYYENFEGIGNQNRLPNCSWSAPTLGDGTKTSNTSMSGNRVANSGSSFAYFDNGTPGTNYYYTNSITMNAGITYSAALWYATEYLGNTNWSSLEILVGPNQSTTGLVQVASISPAASGNYKLLSNVFTVPSSGLYYVAVKAVSAAGGAQYLSWDDLSITIPCYGPGAVNASTLVVTTSAQTVCANSLVSINASGADTYTWSTGANTSGISETPMIPGMTYYTVSGTNMITGCVSMFTQPVMVNAVPNVFVAVQPATVCIGSQAIFMGLGNAVSYLWSNGSMGTAITVTANAPATYTLIGTGSNGCTALAAQAVATWALPVVSVSSSNSGTACNGDMITLTSSGGLTYQWISNTSGNVLQGASVNVYPSAPTTYTVSGTNANGCVGKGTITQNIEECVGINEQVNTLSGLMIYPNPTNGIFVVELKNPALKTIEVVDLTGRVILATTSSDEKTDINMSALANGVYYVKVKTDKGVSFNKVVKN